MHLIAGLHHLTVKGSVNSTMIMRELNGSQMHSLGHFVCNLTKRAGLKEEEKDYRRIYYFKLRLKKSMPSGLHLLSRSANELRRLNSFH